MLKQEFVPSDHWPKGEAFSPEDFWRLYAIWLESDGYCKDINACLREHLKLHEDPRRLEGKTPNGETKTPRAWFCLANCELGPERLFFARVGEVVVVQFCWDRDVPVTRVPLTENIVGGLLIGRHNKEHFLPLYDTELARRLIFRRMEMDRLYAESFLAKNFKIIGWE